MFCQSAGVTKEHVYRRKLQEFVPDPFAYGEFWNFHTGEVRSNLPPPFEQQVKSVCGPCNRGWMNDLEAAVEPYLAPMMQGEAVVLDPDAQSLIARWAVKTMLVRARMDQTMIPASAAHDFYARGEGIDEGTWNVWIGRHSRPAIEDRLEWNDMGLAEPGSAPLPERTVGHIYSTRWFFAAGNFFALVHCGMYEGPEKISATHRSILQNLVTDTDSPLLPILPATDADLTWPPRRIAGSEIAKLRVYLGNTVIHRG